MPVFFNGRLLTTPTVETLVNDGGLAPQSSNIGNSLALLGLADAGTDAHSQHRPCPRNIAQR